MNGISCRMRKDAGPVPRASLLTNDTTVEKLGELLAANPNGLLVFRDELTGWLRQLDKDGQEGARSFTSKAWGGKGSYVFDRIGRSTLHIDSACVSILGGIQPGPLIDYVSAANGQGRGADGLLQRFQLIVWPDDPGTWRNVDRWPEKGPATVPLVCLITSIIWCLCLSVHNRMTPAKSRTCTLTLLHKAYLMNGGLILSAVFVTICRRRFAFSQVPQALPGTGAADSSGRGQ